MFVKLVLGRVADVLDEAADEDDEEALDSELRRWFDVMSMEPLFGIMPPFVGHSDDGEIDEDGDVEDEDEIGRSDEFNEARDDVLTPLFNLLYLNKNYKLIQHIILTFN